MRRRFFLFAAPAIVAAPSLMRVSTLILPPKESILDLMRRRIKAAELAMRADFEREMDKLWEIGNSNPNFGLATLLRDDAPTVGGIDRATFEWWDASHSIVIERA